MAERPSNQFDGEFAALRHAREMETLGGSGGVALVVDAAISLGEKCGLPSCFGLFRRALKQGQPPIEKMVDDIEAAAFEEVRRIWERLEGQKNRQEEFEARLNCQKAETARLCALFHGLRTFDSAKHSRLARLTINSIFAGDFGPEDLDDLMRAAAELSEADISLLKEAYERASPFDMNETDKGRTDSFERMGSVAKLQAAAFVQLRTPGFDMGANIVVLLPKGRKFYERLQEIVV